MIVLAVVFWVSLVLVVYAYLGFPLWTLLRARWTARPCRPADITPTVSIIIAAHNEAESIGAKIRSLLALDYAPDRLEVVVASDGSTDATNAIVGGCRDRRVRLLAMPRGGKARALNAAVAEARGEVLVFSDANSIFAPGALRALVRPLADPQVGGVAGDQRYRDRRNLASSHAGERTYWSLDRVLKRAQSAAGHVTSATGAIYAVRRELFQPIPEGVTDDFVTSTRVIAQGYRLVFAEEAIAYEPMAATGAGEFARKVRVITRGLRAVVRMRHLLNPVRFGFYSVQLFSHKVLRRLVVFPLLALLASSAWLAAAAPVYAAALGTQLVILACAAVGFLLGHTAIGRSKPFSLPYYFCLVNAASLLACWNLVRGRQIEQWSPQRGRGAQRPMATLRQGAAS